jgi:hypothetical protein
MSKHTPGPWVWDFNQETLTGNAGENVMSLGDCYPDGGEPNEADANLIAAAPDLLEALALLESTCGEGLSFDHPIRIHVRNEIAKARGEIKT